MQAWPWFIGLLLTVAVLVWLLDPQIRRCRAFKAELRRRQPVTDEELFTEYFAGSDMRPDVPGRVRRLWSEELGYPREKLLPDDDFLPLVGDLDLSQLIKGLEREFEVTLPPEDIERTAATVRAVCELIASMTDLARK